MHSISRRHGGRWARHRNDYRSWARGASVPRRCGPRLAPRRIDAAPGRPSLRHPAGDIAAICTVILLRRPAAPWPLLLAANRDERLDRPWDTPAPHWPDRPAIIGGRDRLAGGTWMALSRAGVVAAILNRPGTLGPAAGKRSRGDLPLMALDHPTAAAAADAIAGLPAGDWRSFNMVIADRRDAFFLRGLGQGHAAVEPLPEGVSMVTALDPNDLSSPRTRRHLPRFQAATPPDPDRGDWSSWEALLADATPTPGAGIAAALQVPPTGGFGTICSSLLALGAAGQRHWRLTRPGEAWWPVPLP